MPLKEKMFMLASGFTLLFFAGCGPKIFVENGGVLSIQEKKSLVKLVKRARQYYFSRGFHLNYNEIIIEPRNASGFFFHNFISFEEGKPRIIFNKQDLYSTNGDVIVAHEIFHVFQKSYFDFPSTEEYTWLTERTAIAMAVEFTGEIKVLEEFPLDRDKSILENEDASCWFWYHCLKQDKNFVLIFFQDIKEKDLKNPDEIYSHLKRFYRRIFQTELHLDILAESMGKDD